MEKAFASGMQPLLSEVINDGTGRPIKALAILWLVASSLLAQIEPGHAERERTAAVAASVLRHDSTYRPGHREVDYHTTEAPGTIIVETHSRVLYFVLGRSKAIRYVIGVGREGFTWSGVERVSRKAEWPEWRPPKEMLKRDPSLPEFMEGGLRNPLGARALYLGSSEYRIHGTAEPWTIGQMVSSGCIRLTNGDIIDLYDRTRIGTKVIVR